MPRNERPLTGATKPVYLYVVTTISDVARAAGVSKTAVSFALNGRGGIREDTRARILETAEQLGWVPSRPARSLSVSRSFAVGLVIARDPETLRADPFFPSFIAGIEAELSERGLALMLQMVPGHARELDSYRRMVRERRVDGVFVTDLFVDDERPALLRELGLPTVLVGPALTGTGLPCVGVDDRPGIEAAVEHLVSLGHTRIAHVGGPRGMVHAQSRYEAWQHAVAGAGLQPDLYVESDFSARGGAAATGQLLALEQPPTAIVFANDLMALAGVSVATARGVSVPGDLSVTGYDDTEMAAYLQPTLTSVSSEVIAWGQAAARRLLEEIDRRPISEISLPAPQLVVRDSTAPPPRRRRRRP